MKKEERLVESLFELLKEQAELENVINNLPRGYISVKTISGHTYNYRQWREGNKIISEYVPESLLNSMKRKIASRKENEATLKAVKSDVKSVSGKVLRAHLLDAEGIEALKARAKEEIA